VHDDVAPIASTSGDDNIEDTTSAPKNISGSGGIPLPSISKKD